MSNSGWTADGNELRVPPNAGEDTGSGAVPGWVFTSQEESIPAELIDTYGFGGSSGIVAAQIGYDENGNIYYSVFTGSGEMRTGWISAAEPTLALEEARHDFFDFGAPNIGARVVWGLLGRVDLSVNAIDGASLKISGNGGTAKRVMAAKDGVNGGTGTGTTTSASFADVPGPVTTPTIAKQYTDSRLKIEAHCTSFSSAISTGVEFAVRIPATSGTDYVVCATTHNVTSDRKQCSGVLYVPAGIALGSVSARLRWRRSSGAGTLNVNADDYASVSIEEVD